MNQTGTELIVLARYMQGLADQLCKPMSDRIINIHHSVLSSFKGANPYKQVYQRGVKIIGATVIYVGSNCAPAPEKGESKTHCCI